ncbi:MAG: glutamyl-tRNA reductase [Rhabdochlamydiaceae bacterium]|nr:glutamyl-tRNA reductase [Rhabdochlamydiaceae bacterium]
MRIGVLGINHKSSELVVRERLAKACGKKISSENEIAARLSCVVLSTCNRTEIYFSAEDLAAAHSELLNLFRAEIKEPFEHMLYTYFGLDCFTHLALVTSGLDSVILAESEIQRQVKLAYQQTVADYRLPGCLHFLFQKCLKIGKQIRSSMTIPQGQTSLPSMVLQIGQWVFKELSQKKVLFVGNSEINRKIFSYLFAKGVRDLTLCTRSLSSAQEQKQAYGMKVIHFSQMLTWTSYDYIICGTNFSEYLILNEHLSTQEIVETKLILDLSVPRNVDPSISLHPRITLMNMEEVGHLIERKQLKDNVQIRVAENWVWRQVEKQVELFHRKTEPRVFLSCD